MKSLLPLVACALLISACGESKKNDSQRRNKNSQETAAQEAARKNLGPFATCTLETLAEFEGVDFEGKPHNPETYASIVKSQEFEVPEGKEVSFKTNFLSDEENKAKESGDATSLELLKADLQTQKQAQLEITVSGKDMKIKVGTGTTVTNAGPEGTGGHQIGSDNTAIMVKDPRATGDEMKHKMVPLAVQLTCLRKSK